MTKVIIPQVCKGNNPLLVKSCVKFCPCIQYRQLKASKVLSEVVPPCIQYRLLKACKVVTEVLPLCLCINDFTSCCKAMFKILTWGYVKTSSHDFTKSCEGGLFLQ